MKVRDLFVRIGFEVDSAELKQLDRGISQIRSNIKRLTIAFAAAGASLGFFIREAGKAEQVQIAFETMLGSAEAANKLLQDLYAFAAKTPFTISGIEDTARMLMAMGIEQEKIIPTLKALGDVAAGTGTPLERLALNYGQVRTQMKLTGRELRDFAVSKVPLLEILSETMGRNAADIQEMVSRGEVGFAEVERAFISMTSAGGKYHDLMIKQSKTLFGMISNLKDFITLFARGVGNTLLPQAKRMTLELIKWLETNEKLIKTKFVEFFKNVSKFVATAWEIIKGFAVTVKNLADLFGGLERVIKMAAIALGIFVGAQMLMGIGNIVLALNKMVATYSALGKAALFAQLKMLAMPLLVGIAIAALILLLDDLKAYFEGRDSITGLILDAFEKKYPAAFEKTMIGLKTLIQTFKDLGVLIAAVTAMIAGLSTLDWELVKVGAKEFGKVFAPAAEMTGVPGTYRTLTGAGLNRITNVNAPVTVNIPPGTPPEMVGPAIQSGIADAVGEMLRYARSQTEPQIE